MSAETNPKDGKDCGTGVCWWIERATICASAAVIGALVGLAVAMLITLPDLERFWIGTGLLGAAAVWGVSVVARAWWEGRR